MTINWDVLVGLALFLAGCWLVGGPRAAGVVAMLLGVLYVLRAMGAGKERDASGG